MGVAELRRVHTASRAAMASMLQTESSDDEQAEQETQRLMKAVTAADSSMRSRHQRHHSWTPDRMGLNSPGGPSASVAAAAAVTAQPRSAIDTGRLVAHSLLDQEREGAKSRGQQEGAAQQVRVSGWGWGVFKEKKTM